MPWWRSKDRDEEEVLFRRINRCLVDCFADLKHELVRRSVPKVLHRQLTIVNDKTCVAQQVECWCARDSGIAEVIFFLSTADRPVEWVREDGSLA